MATGDRLYPELRNVAYEDKAMKKRAIEKRRLIEETVLDKLACINREYWRLRWFTELTTGYCDGIGSSARKHLFKENKPSEEEQYKEYASVVDRAKGKPVVIRNWISEVINWFTAFINSFSVCGRYDFVWKIYPFSKLIEGDFEQAHGSVQVMYPMISGIEELNKANAILAEVKRALEKKTLLLILQSKSVLW